MIQTETYEIQHEGLIDSGFITYTADTDSGVLSYSGDVKAGPFSIINEPLPPSGTPGSYTINPSELLSANFSKVGGAPVTVGPLTLTVTQIQQTVATVSFTVAGAQATGSAVLDISAEFVKIIGVNANATVEGHTVNLVLIRKAS